MDDAVRIVTTPGTHTAVVAETTTWAAFPELWRDLLAEVWAFLRGSDLAPGRNVMLYLDDVPNVEVGAEVSASFARAGRSRSLIAAGRSGGRVHRTRRALGGEPRGDPCRCAGLVCRQGPCAERSPLGDLRPLGRGPGSCPVRDRGLLAPGARRAPYALSPVIPSPISLAPMIRHSTTMIAALCAVIQSRRPARIEAERSPMPK